MVKVQVPTIQGDWYDITGPITPARAKRIVMALYGEARAVNV